MSLISEQIRAVQYAWEFLYKLRFGKGRLKRTELIEEIRRIVRHYPRSAELEIWKKWLLEKKGHE